MSGPELASALGSSRPAMPVLYVSGYASDVTAFHGLPGLAAHVLAKPFGMDSLVHRVRTILDQRPERDTTPSPSPSPSPGYKWEPETQAERQQETRPEA